MKVEKMSESNGNLLKVCETSSLNSSISNLRSQALLNHIIAGSSSRDKLKCSFKKTVSQRPHNRTRQQPTSDMLYVGAMDAGVGAEADKYKQTRTIK